MTRLVGFGGWSRAVVVLAVPGLVWRLHDDAATLRASAPAPSPAIMSARATGTFDVQLNPQKPDDYADGAALGRMTIDKQYRGDLAGTAKGQMLTALTPVKGSAAYVAIERVTGTLHGRRGSFVLVHRGVMAGGEQQLTLTVVPDSGTDQLTGISGTMQIKIADGRHSYDFEYARPTEP